MKKILLFAALFTVFIVNGAIAGSGSLVGDWEGDATAILPDGTIIKGIRLEGTLDDVNEGLFSGEFTFTLPGEGPVTAFATGYINAQKIQGIVNFRIILTQNF